MTDKLIWRKSSYSGGQGGDCVEVGQDSGAVLVRDTKAREHGHLAVNAATWRRFTDGIKQSRLAQHIKAPRHPHGRRGAGIPDAAIPRRLHPYR